MTKIIGAFRSLMKVPKMQLALCRENILSDIERKIVFFRYIITVYLTNKSTHRAVCIMQNSVVLNLFYKYICS